uniref:Uncharacterized protein MANES_07G140300 n=1 Tax=Rhizophora mucronata TaxID=61149 RepID=A0A2P2MFX8_RHIMU
MESLRQHPVRIKMRDCPFSVVPETPQGRYFLQDLHRVPARSDSATPHCVQDPQFAFGLLVEGSRQDPNVALSRWKKVPTVSNSRPLSVWCWDLQKPLIICGSYTGPLGFRLRFWGSRRNRERDGVSREAFLLLACHDDFCQGLYKHAE